MKKLLSLALVVLMVLSLCPAMAETAAYTEAPALAAKVEAGELPAVADRLPAEPAVLEVEEVGQYGGTLRQAVMSGALNHSQSHMTGYINRNSIIYDRDNQSYTSIFLKDFSWNEDYTEFTFTIREGLKWSDGEPVTTADVAFWFNDVLKNEELTPSETSYTDCTLTVVDDYTWKFNFETGKPLYLAKWAYNSGSMFLQPSHYLKQFHAGYLSADELTATLSAEGFDDWTLMYKDKMNDQKDKDLPVLGPWVLTADPAVTNSLTFERNPYYCVVDQNGQQLPYVDSLLISIVESADLMNMKVIAGEVDVQVAGVQESFSNYPLFAQYAEEMNYTIRTSDFNEPNAMNFHFNVTSKDPVKAPYLSSVDFRRALSLGMDRESVIATFYSVGPYSSEPAQTSWLEGSPYYDEEWAKQYTEFDAEKANALLDELGMTQYDGDGFRMTANGEAFNLVVLCPSFDTTWIEVVEMVCSQWRDNLKLNITSKEIDPGTWNTSCQANEYDITNLTGSCGFLYVAESSITDWAGNRGYNWGTRFMPGVQLTEDDPNYFAPTEDLAALMAAGETAMTTADDAERETALKEIVQLWKDNLYAIGIGRRLPAINIVKNNVHNVGKLDQDWAFGFCATSRADGYWFE